MTEVECSQKYLQELIKDCSRIPLVGLPVEGEFLYHEIPLKEIFLPIRLTHSQNTQAFLYRESEMWNDVNVEYENRNFDTRIRENDLKNIDERLSQFDINENLQNNLSEQFKKLIEFLALSLDPHGFKDFNSEKEEIDTFITQLDSNISTLSENEKTIVDKSKIENVKLFSELAEILEKNSDFKLNNKANGNTRVSIFDRAMLVKRYSNKPVGPILPDIPSRRVILSAPGCGKTTLLRRISLSYASVDDFKTDYDLPGDLFPVLLYCNVLNNMEFIDDFLSMIFLMTKRKYENFDCTENSFATLLAIKAAEGKLLLIIDGLDEIFDKNRQLLFSKALYSFLATNSAVHLILTSRVASFSNSDNFGEEVAKYIKNIPYIKFNRIPLLNKSEVNDFIRKWYDVIFPLDPGKDSFADHIIQQMNSRPFHYLDNMVNVPLHLSNILSIAKIADSIPNNKCKLYSYYLTLSLNWHGTDVTNINDMLTQLAYIACYMTKKGIVSISKNILITVLKQCHQDLDGMFTKPMDSNNIISFIKELEERTCILQKSYVFSNEDIYTFTHLQLQEYLTAYAIYYGCSDRIDNKRHPVDILAKHFRQSSWREVIILVTLMGDKEFASSLVERLFTDSKMNEDNYYTTNLLFEMITNGVELEPDTKHSIYDLLFRDHITDYQLKKICDFSTDDRLNDFMEYVKSKFEDSLKIGKSDYSLSIATIVANSFVSRNENPLVKAQEMVINNNDINMVIGLYIFVVLGWCKYSKINSIFSNYNVQISNAFIGKLQKEIVSENSIYLNDIVTTIKDINLSAYSNSEGFFNEESFLVMVGYLRDENKKLSAEKFLSTFPINYSSLNYNLNSELADLKTTYLEKYHNEFSNPTKADEIVFSFTICAILGCWSIVSDELLNEFLNLEYCFYLNRKTTDDSSKAQMRRLKEQIYSLTDPVSAGFNYYNEHDFKNAKAAFMIALAEGDITVNNNLAYMLRRKEISDVSQNGHSFTIEDLLYNGIQIADTFSIINYALYLAFVENVFSYSKGLEIARTIDSTDTVGVDKAYSWWQEVARSGEAEGYIVVLWLMEIGLINEQTFGSIDDLKRMLYEDFDILT